MVELTELYKGAHVKKALETVLDTKIKILADKGRCPGLAIVRVGSRPDDVYYEQNVLKSCKDKGIGVMKLALPEDVEQKKICKAIQKLNDDERIHGVLLFRPLPKGIDEHAVCNLLKPEKDIDGITDASLAGVFAGTDSGYPPCTAQACMEILDHYGVELAGKKVAVIGRSLVVGKPLAMMLLKENATVTICHTHTADMPAICRKADILVVATGKPKMITMKYFRKGQIVVDVGINTVKGNVCGDVDFDDAKHIVGAITPVPGGVGTVTTTVLLMHVVAAAQKCYDNFINETY